MDIPWFLGEGQHLHSPWGCGGGSCSPFSLGVHVLCVLQTLMGRGGDVAPTVSLHCFLFLFSDGRCVCRFAAAYQGGMHYFVLLIITDGVITDMPQTKEAIVQVCPDPNSNSNTLYYWPFGRPPPRPSPTLFCVKHVGSAEVGGSAQAFGTGANFRPRVGEAEWLYGVIRIVLVEPRPMTRDPACLWISVLKMFTSSLRVHPCTSRTSTQDASLFSA